MKKRIKIAILFLYVTCFPVIVHAASDSRFFGTYCGDYTMTEMLHTYVFKIEAKCDYKETAHGNGLVTGHGTVKRDGTLRNVFVFSGSVTERGKLRGSGILGNMEPTFGSADLSADGNTITIKGMDREVSLKKDRCRNAAPRASIQKPSAGTYSWGETITFSAKATDSEDTSFPNSRLVWLSDRGGKLGNGRLFYRNNLSPGRYKIGFHATDSGGRIASDYVEITIKNDRPNTPVIEQPSTGPYYEGLAVTFRGRASDKEDGNLTGASLVWSSNRDGILGTGNTLSHELTAGAHMITLTATDRAGLSTKQHKSINVLTRPSGNTPPSVTITSPVAYYAMGDTECVTFVAQASDVEDGRLRGGSLSWKDIYVYEGSNVVINLGTGERKDVCNRPAPTGDTRHSIAVTATDSGGLSSTPDSIIIIVIPGGLY